MSANLENQGWWVALYIGIPCLPSDALQVPVKKDDLKSMSGKLEVIEERGALVCKPACLTYDYEMSTESMPLTKKEPHFPNPEWVPNQIDFF